MVSETIPKNGNTVAQQLDATGREIQYCLTIPAAIHFVRDIELTVFLTPNQMLTAFLKPRFLYRMISGVGNMASQSLMVGAPYHLISQNHIQ